MGSSSARTSAIRRRAMIRHRGDAVRRQRQQRHDVGRCGCCGRRRFRSYHRQRAHQQRTLGLAPHRGAIACSARQCLRLGNTATDIQATKDSALRNLGQPRLSPDRVECSPEQRRRGQSRGSYAARLPRTALTVSAGGYRLAGGNWMAYTPTLTVRRLGRIVPSCLGDLPGK